MNETLKEHLISAAITFVATFLTALGSELLTHPSEFMTKETAFIALGSLVITAARSAVKGVAQATGIQK